MMGSAYSIVSATLGLAEEVGRRLRREDLAEVAASHGLDGPSAVALSVRASSEAWALVIDGQPAAAWGVEPINVAARIGVVWMLGTDAITTHPVLFWRLCRREVERLRRDWSLVFNWVDARYGRALRWAARLGFEVDEPELHGVAGMPFCSIRLY